MALNYPGPEQVRIYYTASGRTHVHALNYIPSVAADPGDPFNVITPVERDGGATMGLNNQVDAWIALIKVLFNTLVTFDYAEAWKYTPNSFEATFISSYTIGVAGTNGVSVKAASNVIYTFRTQEGGTFKMSLLDTSVTAGSPVGYAALDVNHKAIVDAVLNTNNVWVARDTSYPLSFVRMYPGENEALFKKIYRQ